MFENKLITVLAISMVFGALIELSKAAPKEVTCGTATGKFCYNCQSYLTCYTVAGSMRNTTTACQTSTPTCSEVSSTTPPSASCTASFAECSCSDNTASISYKADPYNIHFYIVCNGLDAVYIDCKDKIYDSKTNKCVPPPPPPTCPGSGIFEDTDTATCTGFIICSSAGAAPTLGACAEPTPYFNPTTTKCEPTPSLFKCANPDFEIVGDPYDCRRYYVCDGIDNLIDTGCCGLDTKFDTNSFDCIPGACTPLPPPPEQCQAQVI